MSTPKPMDAGTLLPWYVNGTLNERERRDVDSWLGQSEEGQAELLLWRAVQIDTRGRPLAEGGADLGWRRLRAQLPELLPPRVSEPQSAPVAQPTRARPWQWAAAASVVAILAMQTALLLRGPQREIHRPLSVPATPDAWRVQLRLVESATVAELNALLWRHQASISEGPSALGIYTVSVPRSESSSGEELLAELRAEPLVLQVTVAP